MKEITAILSVDKNWGIGYEGKLLCRISGDLKRFKSITSNHIVIMGSTTFKSLPNQKPLPNRINIVLSKKIVLPQTENLHICTDIAEVFLLCKRYAQKKIFIIGGQSIYEQFLPQCTDAFITKINAEFCADAFFPNLDICKDWQIVESSPLQKEQNIAFTYVHYRRIITN